MSVVVAYGEFTRADASSFRDNERKSRSPPLQSMPRPAGSNPIDPSQIGINTTLLSNITLSK